jgi:hypothetical protein
MKVLFWLLVLSVLILLWIAGAVFLRIRRHRSTTTDPAQREELRKHLKSDGEQPPTT